MEQSGDSREYAVSLQMTAQRTIAAVHARLPISAVPNTFRRYLDQVYAAARAGVIQVDGQNVFVYRDAPDRLAEADVAFRCWCDDTVCRSRERRADIPAGWRGRHDDALGKLRGARRRAPRSHRLVPHARKAPCGPALGDVRTLDGGRNAPADRRILFARAVRARSHVTVDRASPPRPLVLTRAAPM